METTNTTTAANTNETQYNIGDGVTLCGWSDREAFTVIARTAKTMTLQRDKATLLNGANSDASDKLQFSPGGFVGHTSGRQRYDYASDEQGQVVVARLTKRGWKYDGKSVIAGRHEHYDYNF